MLFCEEVHFFFFKFGSIRAYFQCAKQLTEGNLHSVKQLSSNTSHLNKSFQITFCPSNHQYQML